MALPRILVLVLAGGAGGRLELLTDDRAKPAVPFAGVYRLIDFPLSNCEHSAIADVWVSVQFHPTSLSDHLANGRPWDLDRTFGGLMMLPPFQGTDRGGWHTGTADSLWRNAELVRQFSPDALVVVSSDAVYKLDYREVVDAHLGSGAEVTMVTTEVAADDASRYGIVQVGDDGSVTDYAYKPDDPATTTATNEVFVFSPTPTLDRLEALADAAGEDGLEDLGNQLLPDQTKGGLARAYPLESYWRDVLAGTPGLPLSRAADRPRRPGVAGAHPRRAAQRGTHPRRRRGRREPDLGRHPRGRDRPRLGALTGRCGREGRDRRRLGAAARRPRARRSHRHPGRP